LTALSDRSPAALLVAVLDPSRAVEEKYLGYVVVTSTGQQISGMVVAETSTSIELANSDGKTTVLSRADIDEMRVTRKSFMPEGVEKDFSPQALADIFAYIGGVGKVPKTMPGNRPRTVVADERGTLTLRPDECRMYGPSIVLEPHFGNLGFWHSDQDWAAWSMEVPAPGRYEVRLEYACPDAAAGNRFEVLVRGARLIGQVVPTGSWADYQIQSIGVLELPAGPAELSIRSAGPIHNALMDLKMVQLQPQ
jgi:putative heme-binding domain-containing protein